MTKKGNKNTLKMLFSASSQWSKICFGYQGIIFNGKKGLKRSPWPLFHSFFFNPSLSMPLLFLSNFGLLKYFCLYRISSWDFLARVKVLIPRSRWKCGYYICNVFNIDIQVNEWCKKLRKEERGLERQVRVNFQNVDICFQN